MKIDISTDTLIYYYIIFQHIALYVRVSMYCIEINVSLRKLCGQFLIIQRQTASPMSQVSYYLQACITRCVVRFFSCTINTPVQCAAALLSIFSWAVRQHTPPFPHERAPPPTNEVHTKHVCTRMYHKWNVPYLPFLLPVIFIY